MPGSWERKAMCGCGQTFRAPFAKLFHVWEECCPKCGAPKSTFVIRTIRWCPTVSVGPFWNRKVVHAGHWEIKE